MSDNDAKQLEETIRAAEQFAARLRNWAAEIDAGVARADVVR